MYWKDTGSGDFEQPEEGNCTGICSWIIDLGTQTGSFKGEPTSRNQTLIAWELTQKMKNGKPFRVVKFYTQSLHENANLRKDLEAWRGRPFTDAEKKQFDPRNLLRKPALLLLVPDKDGKIRISSVSRIPREMTAPTEATDEIYFSLQDYTTEAFEALPKWVREKIAKSPEYKAVSGFNPPLGMLVSDEEAPAEPEEVMF